MIHNNLHVPRARDEQILLMLRLRTIGHSTREIGERLGVSAANARITTNTIKAADFYESGKPMHQTLASRIYSGARHD